jgi:hypothetical protein
MASDGLTTLFAASDGLVEAWVWLAFAGINTLLAARDGLVDT